MAENTYTYLIVGSGLAGGSAVAGIRAHDRQGSLLLIGKEPFLPYNRPPLTKSLWFGKKTVEEIFQNDGTFYAANGAELLLDTQVTALDAAAKTVTDQRGNVYRFEKLLLATGGIPRRLTIAGGELDGVNYYRYLTDYLRIRPAAVEGKTALVIGGGFIGSELSAALTMHKVHVTMLFPEAYLVSRVFPAALGQALTAEFRARGIEIITDVPEAISRRDGRFTTRTKNGREITTDLLIAGVGIQPDVALAQQVGLQVTNGIVVNEYLQTSHPDIYAAGDNAFFPAPALEKSLRVEHWDNAVVQGGWAGSNLAGAYSPYTYLPYFYSDLFEFGYEAVGEVSSNMDTFADWQQENTTGVIYYLGDNRVRGAMMCNIYGKVDEARALINNGTRVATPEELRGAIRAEKKAI